MWSNTPLRRHPIRARTISRGKDSGHFTWCGACGRSHSLPEECSQGRRPEGVCSSSLTRDQAVEKARLHWGDSSQSIGENLVAVLEAFGVVRLKDVPTLKQVLKDILTSLTLPPQSDVGDPTAVTART